MGTLRLAHPTLAGPVAAHEKIGADNVWREKIQGIVDRSNPSGTKQIGLVEQAFGRDLPKDYREFLTVFGQCSFSGDVFSVAADGTKRLMSLMLGVDGNGGILEDSKYHPDYVETGIVPIGRDICGNRFVVDVTDRGHIYFIEYLDVHGNVCEPRLILVAESFSEFVLSLEFEPY